MSPTAKSFAAIALLVAIGLAGCLDDDDTPKTTGPGAATFDASMGLFSAEIGVGADGAAGDTVTVAWAPGGMSSLRLHADASEAVDVTLPPTYLWVDGADTDDASFMLSGPRTLAAGETLHFLAPPSASDFAAEIAGTNHTISSPTGLSAASPTSKLAPGEQIIELMQYQHDNFPHREPGHADGNYDASIRYFTEYLEGLGMEVEVDPYGTQDSTNTTGCSPVGLNSMCPESLANVVARKPGTDPSAGAIFVAGGHFDMVPQTTHAAFDDTSGTIMTLALAEMMSKFTFRHDLYFGLWGGEENGILGSQFWVQSHPELRASIKSYWNLDVVGMSWPSPIVKPDPIVIAAGIDVPTAGTDGSTLDPVSRDLLTWAQELQQAWFGFPERAPVTGEDLWHYEGIASGQVAGYAGVNAQSDHTPFAAAGIPSFFIFNGDALAGDNPVRLHTETDTLLNMTKYAYYGNEFNLEDPTWESAEIEAEANAILADSFDVVTWFPFYHAVLVDLGLYEPPAVTGMLPFPSP